jgi:hypothetical protein
MRAFGEGLCSGRQTELSLPGGGMAHDWIFGLLSDLAAYARRNGLESTAKASEVLLDVARAEIADRRLAPEEIDKVPPPDRRH